jgi:branched-chain amino acid transport system ATP-binding protein
MLKVNDLDVFHGDAQALYSVGFEIQEREILSIVGSNAAGKTTLIRTISGIYRARRGSIRFRGQEISRLSTDKIVASGLVQVPEGRVLFPVMTVLENLELGSISRGKNERKTTLEGIYEVFPILREMKSQLAQNLSGGQQQMLAIGRALMSKPDLLMLDEPSLGLAPKMVAEVFGIIRQINNGGTAVLLVEQNVQQALSLSYRACILENGRVVLQGSSADLINDPQVKKVYLGI